jgi:hypothetical protein
MMKEGSKMKKRTKKVLSLVLSVALLIANTSLSISLMGKNAQSVEAAELLAGGTEEMQPGLGDEGEQTVQGMSESVSDGDGQAVSSGDEVNVQSVTSGDVLNPIIYNIGSQEVTVTEYEEDGSYTIPLENDAFFPYDVQFQTGGKVWVERFATPDSTVIINGHLFRVYSCSGEKQTMSGLGFTINGQYIPAVPQEEKQFTNGRVHRSLLPLKEVRLSVDLSAYTPDELKQVQVSTFLNQLNPSISANESIAEGKAIVWGYFLDKNGNDLYDTYHKIDTYAVVDMSSPYTGSSNYTMEFMMGTDKQLDPDNIRYTVEVELTAMPHSFALNAYYQEADGSRVFMLREGSYASADLSSGQSGEKKYVGGMDLLSSFTGKREYYISLSMDENDGKSLSTSIYRGTYKTDDQLNAALLADPGIDVTAQILNQDMNQTDRGYFVTEQSDLTFTVMYKLGEKLFAMLPLSIHTDYASDYVTWYGLFQGSGEDRKEVPYYLSPDYSYEGNITKQNISFTSTLMSGGYYYFALQYYDSIKGSYDKSKVTKSVEGLYSSLEAAAEQPNITDKLFTDRKDSNLDKTDCGIYGDYSGEGKSFTVFYNTEFTDDQGVIHESVQISQFTITVKEEASSFTSFYVYGLLDKDNDYIYLNPVPESDDTYYQYNYQTYYVREPESDMDLSHVKVSYNFSGKSVYVDTAEQISGETFVDFSKGMVHYSVVAANGDVENYYITILKPEAGAKLYVNGPKEREVYLDDRFGMHHDIFLANIGGEQPLTGLKVTLDAQNVALDDYWTIGGEGNDTLAAYTDKSHYTKDGKYGDGMNNFAKIRLVTGGYEGVISGTLTISADGQDPQVIQLHGWAGNPRVTTESIIEGVKYVPYSTLIKSSIYLDNMFSDYRLVAGELPNGMGMRVNGEIYGVPREVGEFPITIEAYSFIKGEDSYGFDQETVDLVLKINENTDENVAAAVDEGYALEEKVPALMNEYKDRVFRSKGSRQEFVDIYLDGWKLVEGEDYDAQEDSTAITILAKTFEKYGEGTHTIGAEFRKDQETLNEMKRAAQNYTMDLNAIINEPVQPSDPNDSDDSDSSSNSGGSSSSNTGDGSGSGTDSSSTAGDGSDKGTDSSSTAGDGSGSEADEGGEVKVKLYQSIPSDSEITGFYSYPRWLLNAAAGLTEEERQQDVYIETKIKNSACGTLARQALEDMAKLLNAKISNILDISVAKYGKNGAPLEQLTTLKQKIRLSLIIPPGVDAATHDFAVLRLHDGKVDILFDLNSTDNVITFESDQFSDYAIIYADKGSFSALSKELHKSPSTGEIGNQIFISRLAGMTLIFLLISICVQVILLVRNKDS